MVPLGPSLFPLYSHSLRTSDRTDLKTIFFLYHSSDRLDGTARSRLLAPLFYWQRQDEPPEKRLYLFPFLFFRKWSPSDSFTYSIPFYFSHETPASGYRFLFPFWHHAEDHRTLTTVDRVLFPLFRSTRESGAASGAPGPVTRTRLGVKPVLEVLETRSAPGEEAVTAFNFFNWKEETRGGLAIFRHAHSRAADGTEEERTHLFPLYYRYRAPDHDVLVAGPVHGHFGGPRSGWSYYTPFIWRGEGDGNYRSLLLFPFYHRTTRDDPPLSALASYPFFQWERTAEARRFSLFFLLYENTRYQASGKTTQAVLWPLGYFNVEPDGSRGHRRMLPFYYEDWDSTRRLRFGPPFYWNYQSLSGRELEWDFTLVLPNTIGWGAPRDYFLTSFPLYWSFRSGSSGLDILIPPLPPRVQCHLVLVLFPAPHPGELPVPRPHLGDGGGRHGAPVPRLPRQPRRLRGGPPVVARGGEGPAGVLGGAGAPLLLEHPERGGPEPPPLPVPLPAVGSLGEPLLLLPRLRAVPELRRPHPAGLLRAGHLRHLGGAGALGRPGPHAPGLPLVAALLPDGLRPPPDALPPPPPRALAHAERERRPDGGRALLVLAPHPGRR